MSASQLSAVAAAARVASGRAAPLASQATNPGELRPATWSHGAALDSRCSKGGQAREISDVPGAACCATHRLRRGAGRPAPNTLSTLHAWCEA